MIFSTGSDISVLFMIYSLGPANWKHRYLILQLLEFSSSLVQLNVVPVTTFYWQWGWDASLTNLGFIKTATFAQLYWTKGVSHASRLVIFKMKRYRLWGVSDVLWYEIFLDFVSYPSHSWRWRTEESVTQHLNFSFFRLRSVITYLEWN